MNLIASILNIFEGPQGIFILLIILLLFGAKKLPELARGMGQALKEFQKAKNEFTDELHKSATTDTTKAPEVVAAPQTLPRNTDSIPTVAATRPDPAQAVPPGDQTKEA